MTSKAVKATKPQAIAVNMAHESAPRGRHARLGKYLGARLPGHMRDGIK